jgi:lathosterol oxidase
MDVVLEFLDRLVFDQMYATLLPLGSSPLDFLKPNSTLATYEVGSIPATNGWTFEPASQYLSLGPGDAAYLSSWTRDDPWRQMISLFLITW